MSICGLANTDKVPFLFFFFHKRVMTSRLRASSDNNGALEVFQRTTKKKREKKKNHLANLSNASYSQLAPQIKADFESDDWILRFASQGIKAAETQSVRFSQWARRRVFYETKKGRDQREDVYSPGQKKKKAFPSSSVLWHTSRSAAASRSELATDGNGSVGVVPPGTNGSLLMGW